MMRRLQKAAADKLNIFTFPEAYAKEAQRSGRIAELGGIGGLAGAGILSGLAGGSLAASMSKENKVRNAVLAGLLSGAVGAGASYYPIRDLVGNLHGRHMLNWTKKNAPWVNLP